MKTSRRTITFLLLILFLTLGIVSPVMAHGDGEKLEISYVPIGPYKISAWSLPGVLRTGEVHFATAVVDDNLEPVTDCDIKIQLTPLDENGSPLLLQTRAPIPETLFRHEIEEDIYEPGRYQVTVLLTDPKGNEGQTSFEVEIIEIPLYIKIPLFASMAFVAVVGLMLVQKGIVLFGLWQPKKAKKPVLRRPV